MTPRNRVLALILICALVPLALYLNALSAPFVFDDFANIVQNPDIQDWQRMKSKLLSRQGPGLRKNDPSRPIPYLTFALNFALGGLQPFGYHLVNVLLHGWVVLMVFLLSREALRHGAGRETRASPDSWALAAALLFAVHPLQTEVAAYVSHRTESLAAGFYLTSLWLTVRSLEGGRSRLPSALICYALALFCKQHAVTLPALLLAFDWIFVARFRVAEIQARKRVHAPFWLLAALFLAFRYFYFGTVGDAMTDAYRRWTPWTYGAVQLEVWLRYLQLLFVPVGQAIDHFIPPPANAWGTRTLLAGAALASLLGGLCALYRRARQTAEADGRLEGPGLFAGLWFMIALLPTSSLIPINDAMTERRLYLPAFGFALGMIVLYRAVFRRKVQVFSLVLIHALALSLATWNRNNLYANPALIWAQAVARYPDNVRAHYILGGIYVLNRDYEKARASYERALELNPDFADCLISLGMVQYALQEKDEAAGSFQKALGLDPRQATAHANLATLYSERKDYGKALEHYDLALELQPESGALYYNRAAAYYQAGDRAAARRDCERAARLLADQPFLREKTERLIQSLENPPAATEIERK